MIGDILSAYRGKCAGHLELRAQTNLTNTVILTNGNLVTNTHSEVSGVFARRFKDGLFGAYSAAGFSPEAIRDVLEGSAKNLEILAASATASGKQLPDVASGTVSAHVTYTPSEQKQLLEFMKALDARIAERYPVLISRTLRLGDECTEARLMVTSGTDCHRILSRCFIRVFFVVKDQNGNPVDLYTVLGGSGQFADHFKNPSDFDEQLDSLYKMVMDKSEGVYAEAGVHDLILDPNLAGILAHEAVGHTTESDLIRGGSIASRLRGQRVATEKVTLIDFAHTAFGKQAPLPIYVDDEGTPAEDVVIIKDGILLDYMSNRLDAPVVGTTPKGNGRAFSYKDEPIVRMRNTCIAPGTDKLEDMIAAVEKGYYLTNTNNGQADGTSEFMFGIGMGYEIRNGKLGKAIRDTTMSGIAFDMLKTVDMVGDTIVWMDSGMCGKKQPLRNAMGGPAIKCRASLGGR